MTDDARRPLSEEARARIHAARYEGGLCAGCGRALFEEEPVWWHRFAVTGTYGRLAHWRAPVGRECASPELLDETEGRAPERCVYCRRGVCYGLESDRPVVAVCSIRCRARRMYASRPPSPPRVIEPRSCAICGQSFRPKRSDGRTCSQQCRNRAAYTRRRQGSG